MSTPPRRRRPDARDPKPGGGWLPTLAMGLGVIVAGLGIGALVAVFMQRGSGGGAVVPTPVALVTQTPGPGPAFTRPPLALATLRPPRTARPSSSPSATPAPADSAAPTDTPAPADSPAPTDAASPAGTPSPAPTATTLPATAVPRTTAMAAGSPAPARTPVVTAEPTTPLPSPAVPTAYDEHASAVVRRYIDALIRGDEKVAYSALGGSGTLSEQTFLDPSARIVALKVTRIDASNATVGCEIESAKGRYYGTYHVTAAPAGPYISEHDFIKV